MHGICWTSNLSEGLMYKVSQALVSSKFLHSFLRYCRLANNHYGFIISLCLRWSFFHEIKPIVKTIINFQSFISITGTKLCSNSLYVRNNHLLNLSLHCFDVTPVVFTMKCIVIIIVTWMAFFSEVLMQKLGGSQFKTPNFVTARRQHL
jgi:hypothetical protein